MIKIQTQILRFLIIFVSLNLLLKAQSVDSVTYKKNIIETSNLIFHINILTSDSIEGRESASLGQKKAAKYISDYFYSLKLKPIADIGTYYQQFDVKMCYISPATKIVLQNNNSKTEYKWGKDFITDRSKDTTVSGKLAFVGFIDTELDAESRERIKDHIIVAFMGKKSYAGDTSNTILWRRINAIRQDNNIKAILIITDRDGNASFEGILKIAEDMNWDKGWMQLKEDTPKDKKSELLKFFLSAKMAEDLIEPSGFSIEQLKNIALTNEQFNPIYLENSHMTIESRVNTEIKQTENVIGILEGSDATCSKDVIVISAHYDHLGKNKDGAIYPGADDNGSGVATMLELARFFSIKANRPRHSLMFIAFSGEEKGLLGSRYYVENPVIHLDQTLFVINLDMIGRLDTEHTLINDTNYIYVITSDKPCSKIDSILYVSNQETVNFKLDYSYNDKFSTEQLFRRNDYYNFAAKGIPGLFFFTGFHEDYHKISDRMDKIVFERLIKIGSLIYDFVLKISYTKDLKNICN